jgi:hypothetical protein
MPASADSGFAAENRQGPPAREALSGRRKVPDSISKF